MLLEGKSAVIYGAGGAVGAAVAKAFAAEGARIALTGPRVDGLETLQMQIRANGGEADIAVVDAYEEQVVEDQLARFVSQIGRLDISFNAVGLQNLIADLLTDESTDDFVKVVERAMRAQFVTAKAAGKQMMRAGSGVILTIVASPTRLPQARQGTIGVIGAAIDALYRQLAVDLGPYGVRTVCLCSAGSPDSAGVDHAMTLGANSAGTTREAFEQELARRTALNRFPRLAEVGAVAALMASDHASAVTGTLANVTCGQIPT